MNPYKNNQKIITKRLIQTTKQNTEFNSDIRKEEEEEVWWQKQMSSHCDVKETSTLYFNYSHLKAKTST